MKKTPMQKAGFHLLAFPTSDLAPLDVLVTNRKSGTLRVGRLDQFVRTEATPPLPGEPTPAPSLVSHMDKSVGAQAGLLSKLMALTGASVTGSVSSNRSRELAFNDVQRISVPLVEVGDYLAGAVVQSDNPAVRDAFDNRVHVVLDVLNCDGFTMSGTKDAAVSAEVDGGEKGQVGMQTTSESSDVLQFDGGRIVVAVKVVALDVRGDSLEILTRKRTALDFAGEEMVSAEAWSIGSTP